MSDILVIKVKDGVNVSVKTMQHWKNEIRRMKESGIVILPWYLHAEVVPEDIEIKVEDFDVDKYIKDNYRPVEDKPGYVWFNQRNCQMISIENLKASLEEYEKIGGHPGYIMTEEEIHQCLQTSDQN